VVCQGKGFEAATLMKSSNSIWTHATPHPSKNNVRVKPGTHLACELQHRPNPKTGSYMHNKMFHIVVDGPGGTQCFMVTDVKKFENLEAAEDAFRTSLEEAGYEMIDFEVLYIQ
jgi:hypothetical protein